MFILKSISPVSAIENPTAFIKAILNQLNISTIRKTSLERQFLDVMKDDFKKRSVLSSRGSDVTLAVTGIHLKFINNHDDPCLQIHLLDNHESGRYSLANGFFYGSIPISIPKESTTNIVKETYNGVRLRKVIKAMGDASSPVGAFDILCEFLEHDTEFNVGFKHNNAKVKCAFNYVDGIISATFNITDTRTDVTLVNMDFHLTRDRIDVVWGSLESLLNKIG